MQEEKGLKVSRKKALSPFSTPMGKSKSTPAWCGLRGEHPQFWKETLTHCSVSPINSLVSQSVVCWNCTSVCHRDQGRWGLGAKGPLHLPEGILHTESGVVQAGLELLNLDSIPQVLGYRCIPTCLEFFLFLFQKCLCTHKQSSESFSLVFSFLLNWNAPTLSMTHSIWRQQRAHKGDRVEVKGDIRQSDKLQVLSSISNSGSMSD